MGSTRVRVWLRQHLPWSLLMLVLVWGCDNRNARREVADSSGTIVGRIEDASVHGNTFYGSPVFLIKGDSSGVEWWKLIQRYHPVIAYPEREARDLVIAKTTYGVQSAGKYGFRFSRVPPGPYFIYSRVFWANRFRDTTLVGGEGYGSTAEVTPRETLEVWLGSARFGFTGEYEKGTIREPRY